MGRPPGTGKKKTAPDERERERKVVVWMGLEGEATWKESIPDGARAEDILGIIKAKHRLGGVYELRTRNHGVEEEFRVASNLEYRAVKREFLSSSEPEAGGQREELPTGSIPSTERETPETHVVTAKFQSFSLWTPTEIVEGGSVEFTAHPKVERV
jgi:hypothetical protein